MKNLLFITVDQWRGDSLTHLGHPFVQTPVLDALASRGVSFRSHIGQSTPCAPSRASIFTSRYLHSHRVFTNQTEFGSHLKTLPLHLRELGYDPYVAGYTSTMWPAAGRPASDPFPKAPRIGPGWSVLREMDDDKQHYLAWLKRRGYGRFDSFKEIFDVQPAVAGQIPVSPLPEAHSETAWIVDAAEEFVGYGRSEPWALHVSIFKPHPPSYPSAYRAEQVRARSHLPAPRVLPADSALAQHPFMRHALQRIKADYLWNHLPGLASDLPADTVDWIRRAYFATCEEVDAQLGRLLSALEASGQQDNTLVIVTSDHAEMLGDYRCFGKYTLLPESYHVPLIVVDPAPECDGTRGLIVDDLTESVDVLPTLMACLGGPPDPRWEGVSLRDYLIEGAVPNPKEEAFMEYDFRFDPPAVLGELATLPEYARSGAAVLTSHSLVASFPAFEPIVLQRLPTARGFEWVTPADDVHDALQWEGLRRLLRRRQLQHDLPLQVPRRGSMVR